MQSFADIFAVKDCEVIRKALLGDRKWTLMGQSFGGFCAITYLSFHSEGVEEVFLTGGLAPLVDDPDSVYEALIREHFLWLFQKVSATFS